MKDTCVCSSTARLTVLLRARKHEARRQDTFIGGTGSWGAGAYLQQSMGERRGPPWTGRHTLIHTSKGNLESPINLIGMYLDCGRKPEYPVRTHACLGRTCKLHAERPRPGIEPRTFLLQGNSDTNCTTMQPTMEISHY
ncbi:hypothetical protein CHARACLAT_005146 [Characodon lateralis]|uniref:Uncharacterized protein n=1 Tax=Characodon lateralis TaxID=208331 RepID=A0ABU7EGH9_9TELE|nr:hypothetical protein [Characodon lateralis]